MARITCPFFQERVGLVRKISTSDPTSAKMVEILGVAELAFEPHDTDIACYCISQGFSMGSSGFGIARLVPLQLLASGDAFVSLNLFSCLVSGLEST